MSYEQQPKGDAKMPTEAMCRIHHGLKLPGTAACGERWASERAVTGAPVNALAPRTPVVSFQAQVLLHWGVESTYALTLTQRVIMRYQPYWRDVGLGTYSARAGPVRCGRCTLFLAAMKLGLQVAKIPVHTPLFFLPVMGILKKRSTHRWHASRYLALTQLDRDLCPQP